MEEKPNVLGQAKELLAQGKAEESLTLVRNYWLENPDDTEAVTLMSEIMRERGRSDLSKRLTKLSEHLPVAPHAAASEHTVSASSASRTESKKQDKQDNVALGRDLFEAGYSLIEARQHELAAMLLNRGAKIAPGEPTVNYELGFALMSMKRFEQAIPYLEESLAKDNEFDTLLNLLVCYILTRQVDKARLTLEKIGQIKLNGEQSKELMHKQVVVKRLESVGSKTNLNARDWLYILYGSVLLRTSTRQYRIKEDAATIGQMLAVLKGVLGGLCVDQPEAIEFYGPQSRPLAHSLAEFFEVPMSAYKGPRRKEPALLTMTWASDIIGPHKSFVAKEKDRHLFSYALSWDEPLPVVPDIVGCLAFDEPMPWRVYDSEGQPLSGGAIGDHHFTAEIEKAYKEILANARDLESDPATIKHVEDALNYYEGKRTYLIVGNAKALGSRSEYTAEILD
jgi:tetratricopeptide (TPR) repeat protein